VAREYREAMRKASLAEKKQDWDEYEKQMSIAEDFAIGRMNNSQALVAKYGDARDVILIRSVLSLTNNCRKQRPRL
jgi:hypothetical protein